MAVESVMARQVENRVLDTTNRVAFKNIMYATDFSSVSERSVTYAIEIARRYRAMLHVAHVTSGKKLTAFCSEAKAKLEEQLQSVPHEWIFQEGEVWPTLSDLIRVKQADLLVLGTHGRSGIEKVMMGSVAETIFREADCPVLTVGPKIKAQSPHAAELTLILYATNFSPESLVAAPYAISLAQEQRAQLILLNCLDDRAGDARAMLQTLGQLVPFGTDLRCEPICVVERGPHGRKILDVSEGHGADLLVLGIEGRSKLVQELNFHHSELYKIVAQATCPVLTVRA